MVRRDGCSDCPVEASSWSETSYMRCSYAVWIGSRLMDEDLQDERMRSVLAQLLGSGARSVLDLGCGPGDLLVRLVEEAQFERIVGIDLSAAELAIARERLQLHLAQDPPRIELRQASFTDARAGLQGFDAAALVETIEHVDPNRLSDIERAVFGAFAPGAVFVSTPNQEFNAVYGMRPGQMRHPDHRFEWTRAKFRTWARGVAARQGYSVRFVDIGQPEPGYGAPTQMACFDKQDTT